MSAPNGEGLPGRNREAQGAARPKDTVTRRADVPAPPTDCPACGLPGDRVVVHVRGTIWTASYLDNLDHVWTLQWSA